MKNEKPIIAMKFVVIGITDNPVPFFHPEMLETIRHGRVFSGGRRHHEIVAPLLPTDAEWIDITAPVEAVVERYKQACFNPIIVFASGDPLFFGFANTLRRLLPDAEIQLFPAFNSLQLLAHRLVLPYHDLRVVSLTGRPWPEFDRALIDRAPKMGVLTDREHTPAAIARRMLEYGYCYYTMHVGEHLGNPALERISTLTLEQAAGREFAMPNCLILHCPSLKDPFPLKYGLPDSSFALLDGREKMITKMPIRLLTLQALELPRRRVLWDIGACTGSVSIEARLLFPHLHVEAFEIRPECEAIISENARRHGAPGIELHIGDFLSFCCDSLATPTPSPDAIFIGGHGGQLKAIMAKAVAALLPGGVIAMNSVTSPVVEQMTAHRPGSRQLWDEACAELGLVQEPPLRVQLNDYNPIEILKATKPS